MRRREFILALGGAAVAWPLAARAQQPAKIFRIGLLSPFSPTNTALWHRAFLRGLSDLGWVDGKNIAIEYRYAEGRNDRLPGLIADLIQLKVDIIVTAVTNDTLAAKKATSRIPIVMAAAGDPVATGIVASLARPGGNVTGLSQMNPELNGKRLELLKEIAPGISSMAVLLNPEDPISTLGWKEIELPAQKLKVEAHVLEVRDTAELDKALQEAVKARMNALAIMPNPVFVQNLKRIADFALQNRLPSMFHLREFANVGGLVSYGVDRNDLFQRAAAYVDKILKGASPADLPVEQPTKFELVINLKTAKALGLTVPPTLLARADEVIE
jgi:putative ABC transport system substrate-binding protein